MNKVEAIDWQIERTTEELDAIARRVTELKARVQSLEQARAHALSDTPIGAGPVTCSHCDADVSTERLFTAHYVIPDARLYNIGHCPNR